MSDMFRVENVTYDLAEICGNGHVISTRAMSHPGERRKFCPACGAATTEECAKCHARIRGQSNQMYDTWRQPSYCAECSSPYPWTEKHLAAGAELIDQAVLGADEKAELKRELQEIVHDSPRSKVAALKIGKFIKTAGPELAGAMRQIVVDVATDAVKKQMGL